MFSRRRCSSYSVSTDSSDASSSQPPDGDDSVAASSRSADAIEPRDQILDEIGASSPGPPAAVVADDAVEQRRPPRTADRASPACSSTRPRRSESSRFSRLCDRLVMRVTPNSPDRPLSECTARKASLMTSGSNAPAARCSSSASRSRLKLSTISCASDEELLQRLLGGVSGHAAHFSRLASRSRAAPRARTA